jgi:glycosyl transferase family 25
MNIGVSGHRIAAADRDNERSIWPNVISLRRMISVIASVLLPMRPKSYVISLKSANERRSAIGRRLRAARIDFDIVDAVDGRRFEVEAQPIYDGPRRRALYGHDMLGGEIGCLLSHRAVLRQIVARGRGPALVFEDDILPHPRLGAVIDALMDHQGQWELVRFLGGEKILRQPQRPLVDLGEGFRLSRLATQPGGAAAYLISETGAARLLKHLDRTPFPIDALMGRPWLTGVDNLIAGPGLADQDRALGSDIGGGRFVSHGQIAARSRLGRKITVAGRRLGDNIASRGLYWATAPGDYLNRLSQPRARQAARYQLTPRSSSSTRTWPR